MPDLVASRLLALSIVTQTLGEHRETEAAFPVELVQLSLQTQSPFMHYTQTADDKVGGMSLARFSGFLKRSWRMNDWTWGRLDAATVLCQVLLDPARLRRLAALDTLLRPPQRPAARRRRDYQAELHRRAELVRLLAGWHLAQRHARRAAGLLLLRLSGATGIR